MVGVELVGRPCCGGCGGKVHRHGAGKAGLIGDRGLALETLDELSRDLHDETFSPELNKLGRTLRAWRTHITNWHLCKAANGPTEAANNLAKPIKRISFGTANFDHYRTRVLLYAGKPDSSLPDDPTPRQNAKNP